MGRPLIVLGAGGHAKVVIATLRAAGRAPTMVLDDDPQRWGTRALDVPVEGPVERCRHLGPHEAILAIGDNRIRRRLAAELEDATAITWATAVHPAATVDPSVRLGPGSVVFAGAVVQPDTVVGSHVIVNTAASVDHDCSVDDFAHVGPGSHLGGHVRVGEGSLLGIGSIVLPTCTIGAWAVIGAGATVTGRVEDGWTVTGTPAQRRRL
jgi:sugar O-acyltransferase (sialic acid O-acetyltransferase NeuD family)